MTENRPDNVPFNNRQGTSPHNDFPRVTGAYTGTTDQIIQWAASVGVELEITTLGIASQEALAFE